MTLLEWDEVVGDCVDGQAREGVDLELANDITAMSCDRVDRYEKTVCNLLVRHPLNQAYNDLFLAFGD